MIWQWWVRKLTHPTNPLRIIDIKKFVIARNDFFF